MNWINQINNEIKCIAPSIYDGMEQWTKHSIYKIPSIVTNPNRKAYKPQAISFGPYHYGEEHLMAMEEHKHRALVHFLKRCEKPIEFVFQAMEQVVQELRDSYKPLDPIWILDTPKFIQMMILDGCFTLEILRANHNHCVVDDYAENDPIFSEHGRFYILPYIKRDMLMLENQIPMTFLRTLIQLEIRTEQEYDHELLNEKIVKLLNPRTPLIQSLGKCMHILDVYRKSLIQQGPSHPTRMPKETKRNWLTLEAGEEIHYAKSLRVVVIIRSAVELHEAGIRFRKSKTLSLRDVSFDRGVLRLPILVVDDTTEYMLLNLIAFERLHVGAGNEITSFIFFMDTMVDNAADVAILNRKGIIINALGSDKIVSRLFNSLSRDIAVDRHGVLEVARTSMSGFCKKPWNRWRANLIHTYFRNPWAIVSLIAGIFLFVLTTIQTIYSVKKSYENSGQMTFSMNNCSASIKILNGSNFKKWKKDLEFSLGIADLDMALHETKHVINDQSTPEEKEKLAKWERSDRLSSCAMKRTISEHVISGLPEKENAKEYLAAIRKRFQVSDNVESGYLLKQLTDMSKPNGKPMTLT
ncbi:UPF0481 protein At3g47200-like [Vicia villosa]|uniref:UPF0481 protein At3g47200-like n=1 Tax=Vicia villosa TaxID=3911 RepID=UPI00273C7AD4|nr:UPF0481 protein At3g47200-like [Vicia villosa]